MPSNNSLSDKVARNPLRFGLLAGFLGVPLLWMAGDSLVRIVMGQGPLPVESFWKYEGDGALIGAFLGGQEFASGHDGVAAIYPRPVALPS